MPLTPVEKALEEYQKCREKTYGESVLKKTPSSPHRQLFGGYSLTSPNTVARHAERDARSLRERQKKAAEIITEHYSARKKLQTAPRSTSFFSTSHSTNNHPSFSSTHSSPW